MKTIYFFLILFTSLAIISCSDERPTSVKSFEITIEKDTINMTDFNGLKQGKWIIIKDGEPDTLFYKDDVEQK